VAERSKALPC